MKTTIKSITISLLFLSIITIGTVYAGKSTVIQTFDTYDDFEGNITFDKAPGGTGKHWDGKPDVYTDSTPNYKVYNINFSGSNGRSGQAFCVYPSLTAAGNNPVNCGRVTPQDFPRTYYAAFTYWDELKNDRKLADFVMRMSGIYDKDGGVHDAHVRFCESVGWNQNEHPDCDYNVYHDWKFCNSNPLHPECKKWDYTSVYEAGEQLLESSFVKSYQVRVQGSIDETPGDPTLFKGNKTDRGYAILKDVNNHIDEVRKTWTIDTQSRSQDDTSSGVNSKTGKIFKITRLNPGKIDIKTADFLIETIDNTLIPDIKVEVKGGSYSWTSPWNGTSGQIHLVSDEKCNPSITIYANVKDNSFCRNGHIEYEPCTNCVSYDCPECHEEPYTYYTCKYGKGGEPYDCTPHEGTRNVCNKCLKDGVRRVCVETASSNDDKDIELGLEGYAKEGDLTLEGYESANDISYSTLNTAFNPQEAKSGFDVYFCHMSGDNNQSYIVIVDGESNQDYFDHLNIYCDNCYEGDCIKTDIDIVESDIHNCCDGVESYARQAALDELFCTERRGDVIIPEYRKQCDTDRIAEEEVISERYCSQYCTTTIKYNIPGPTHAKSDAFFTFSSQWTGQTGPTYKEFRRCRTLIHYDVFNKDYGEKVKQIIDKYNEYQKAISIQDTWKEMIDVNSKKSVSENVTCSSVITYKYRCKTGSHQDCTSHNSCVATCNGLPTLTAQRSCLSNCHGCDTVDDYDDNCSGSYTISETSDSITKDDVRYYNVSSYSEKYKYTKFKLSGSDNSWSAAVDSYHNTLGISGYLYNKEDIDAFKSSYDSAKQSTADVVNSEKESWNCDATNCKHIDRPTATCGDFPTDSYPTVDINSKWSEVTGSTNSAINAYKAVVGELESIQQLHDICGAKYTGETTIDPSSLEQYEKSIKKRIKFDVAPELEVEYYQQYLTKEGKLDEQTLAVKFYHIDDKGNKMPDDKKCVDTYYSSLTDSPWSDKFDKTGWQDDHYANKDASDHTAVFKNYSSAGLSRNTGAYTGYSSTPYYSNKKYTTDSVGYRECRWKDDEGSSNTGYSLVPNGIIITYYDSGWKELKSIYNGREGYYHIWKTVTKGKYEIYYIMKNLPNPFPSYIKAKGQTCSGEYATETLGDEEVALTCYIEIEKPGWEIMDCNSTVDVFCPKECCDDNYIENHVMGSKTYVPKVNNIDCSGCGLAPTTDYKEVDPINPFPNINNYRSSDESKDSTKISSGYAWNWYEGPNGQKVLKRLQDDAKADKTYSKEN